MWSLVMLLIGILTLIIPHAIFGSKELNPTVTTPLGKIEGYTGFTVSKNHFYKFEGIPYAKPPVGDLRFEEPQDPQPWIGILKANVLTKCMQHDHLTREYDKKYADTGDEDCLYVNIYTHDTSPTANLDVLVHIHGGAFMFGNGGNYGPEIVMDRNIVFVNLNYRLGPLGFLSTEDEVLPGNNGLRDQTKALKWIKENIQYFGGNPNSITIHGWSAGGASVHFHYLLPASKGLFNQGISQSGCTLNAWVIMENAREKTKKVADLVGCPSSSSQEILNCLKTKPAKNIVQTVREFQPWLYNPFSPFAPVVDGYWSKNPVLPDHPYKLLEQGKVQDLPWIISYTTDEGLYPAAEFWTDDQYLLDIDTKWNDIMPFVLHYNESVEPCLKDEISQKIRRQYLGNKPVNRDTYRVLVDLVGDRLYIADIEKAARLHSAAVTTKVFSYWYNYRGRISFSDVMTGTRVNLGVSHADDTLMVLKMVYFDKNELETESDKKVSKLMVDLTTSFMLEGSPNITNKWISVSKEQNNLFNLLKINNYNDLELLQKDSVGHRDFWDSLPLKENEKLFPIKDE